MRLDLILVDLNGSNDASRSISKLESKVRIPGPVEPLSSQCASNPRTRACPAAVDLRFPTTREGLSLEDFKHIERALCRGTQRRNRRKLTNSERDD